MLIRLTDHVESGSIDNRRKDIVKISLNLMGEIDPLEFNLEGNCHRDLAGRRLDFKIKEQYLHTLSGNPPCHEGTFSGIAGDVTTLRGKKHLLADGKPGTALYVEAYLTDLDTLFIIDSNKFDLSLSSQSEWAMDAAEEQATIMCNQQIMREHVKTWIKNYAATTEDSPSLPNHRWDVRLREAEGVAIAHQEVRHKYRNITCGDTCEAFVMGWDDILGEMANAEENGTSYCWRISGTLNLFDILNDEEAIEMQLCISYPIFQSVIDITETAQKLFAKQINDLQATGKPLPEETTTVLHAIRYVTPNILSCLLQMNDSDPQYDVMAERMKRCAEHISRAVETVGKMGKQKTKPFCGKLAILHEDIIDMRNDLLKQSKL